MYCMNLYTFSLVTTYAGQQYTSTQGTFETAYHKRILPSKAHIRQKAFL